MQTVLDQCHLSPLPLSVRPTLWDYDHTLRLYPMPTAVRLHVLFCSSPRLFDNLAYVLFLPSFQLTAHSRRQVRTLRADLRRLPRLQPRKIRRRRVRMVDLLSCDTEEREEVSFSHYPLFALEAALTLRPFFNSVLPDEE